MNLSYICGAAPGQMVPSTSVNMAATSLILLSSTDLVPSPLLCAGGGVALYMASTCLMSALTESASQLSYANRNRADHTIDATMFFWSLPPLVQAFSLMDSIAPE